MGARVPNARDSPRTYELSWLDILEAPPPAEQRFFRASWETGTVLWRKRVDWPRTGVGGLM
eukprot:7287558-Pyramimonas_sp.AAC.1